MIEIFIILLWFSLFVGFWCWCCWRRKKEREREKNTTTKHKYLFVASYSLLHSLLSLSLSPYLSYHFRS
ncbi:hypothetical protein RIF29_42024 [Crotalaria pallida]|uniref:Uncharacterized protein n=1 Tax=Crotalaria pallida TaxID=3830 RepID=A0AAN9EC63_CROPI